LIVGINQKILSCALNPKDAFPVKAFLVTLVENNHQFFSKMIACTPSSVSIPAWLKKSYIIAGTLVLISLGNIWGQGPGSLFVDAGPDVVIDCSSGNGCANLTANFLQTFNPSTNLYSIASIPYNPPFPFNGLANSLNPNIDDAWSDVETLPFDFCYFENIDTEFQIGSNGVIRFGVDPNDTGSGSNGWDFDEDLPNNSNPTLGEANVFTPGHDIDPSVSTTEEIGYEVLGTFPNRVLVVAYYEVPMFSGACNNLLATQMVVFYEFSNVVEIYMQDKPVCPTWNDGNAALGIQNNDGNIAYVPPGRNTSDSPWTTNDEAWSFSPAGDPTYVFEWLDSGGAVIGTNPNIEVCPTDIAVYTARVTYTNCNGEVVVLTDDVEVTPTGGSFGVDLGGDQALCDTASYDITAEVDGIDPADATYLWSTGETTQTITVTTTDVYSVDVTANGCTVSQSVAITFLISPNCTVAADCEGVDFNEDFGTGTGRVCDLGGATTTYICNTATQVEDGEYTISNTSTGLNSGWHMGMEDHTEGDVDGRMLFVNADFNPGEFYRNTITLSENTDYTFSAWITTVYDTDTNICGGNSIPSNVIFRIEDPSNNLIEETNTGDIPNGPDPNWQQFFINFNTGTNTDVQLVLINNSIGGCGNDLALDDITLSYQNPEPQIVTPADLSACDDTGTGIGTFDLDSQIPTILDGQDPALFNTSFHLSQLEAEANTNPLSNTAAYNNTNNPESIFVRVEKVSDEDCFSVVSFELTVEALIDFEIQLPVSTVLCENDPFPTLDATPQNSNIDLTQVTYEWVDGGGTVVGSEATYTPIAAGTYTVTVTLAPCNEEVHTSEVVVQTPPTLNLGADQIICDGGQYTITPSIQGDTQGITYLWSTGDTTPTITVNTSGDYSLEITVGPCVVSDSIAISIAELPSIDLGEDFESCFDQNTVLDASPSNYDPTLASYEWSLDGTVIPEETDPLLFVEQGGIYSVVVTVENCASEDSVTITPREDLVVTVDEDFKTCPDEARILTATTSETDVAYQWYLNGEIITGATSSTFEFSIPAHTLGEQVYSVVISVGDCTGEDSVSVILYDVGQCVISEGLSPNGDGYNDCLDLEFIADRTGSFSLEVFNRYGMSVYSNDNYVNEFCGVSDDGNELPTGTYFYVMKFKTPDPVYGSLKTGWVYLNKEAN